MKRLHFIALLCLAVPLLGEESAPPPLPFEEPAHLLVTNRILAKVNGKTISVIDVVKKMDVFLNRAYPQYANSKLARFQFYTNQWRNTLNQMIDNELILADAASIELKVSDGEVREALQGRFGPNVMANLEKIGITYEEAKEMILSEITVERMTWYRVNSKVYLGINPQDIKSAYLEYCKKNPSVNAWKYQVLSLRGKDREHLALLADKADALRAGGEALEKIHQALEREVEENERVTLALSPVYDVNERTLSQAHKTSLETLAPGEISAPQMQTSRDGTTLFRLFYLEDKTSKELPSFEKMSDTLHQNLMEQEAIKETGRYLAKLRQKFSFDQPHFEASIPSDFQPFAIK